MKLKEFIPKKYKLQYKLFKRFVNENILSNIQYAKKQGQIAREFMQIEISQTIKQTSYVENKISNLQLSSEKLNHLIIYPNEVFSFWKTIGSPTQSNGYKVGRNLVKGQLKEEVGGGLCQLSGLLYYISILSNLNILERHNHSVDIYNEKTRFTPLGTDATVVYGYKDLQVQNNKSHPIQFWITVNKDQIIGSILCEEYIIKKELDFEISIENGYKKVIVLDRMGQIINQSIYLEHSVT